MEKQKSSQRLQSLDALRGFDMFFIMGGATLIAAIATFWPNDFTQWLASQMGHVEWNGLAHHDTIFPLFLFIAGISFPFSLEKQRLSGKSEGQIYKKIIRRGLTLVLLGIIYNGFLSHWDFANARYASVLARIGLAWMFGALIFINTKWKTRAIIVAVILIGYWLVSAFVGAPDHPGADPLTREGCLAGYIDRIMLPGRVYQGDYDPEGIFSTIPAIATALLGMFTGEWIKYEKEGLTPAKKTLYMVIAGIALLVIGLIWNTFYPSNKMLWSSTFVCLVGAYSVLMFALFYYIIDVKNHRGWILFFVVIGMNSITIYLAQHFINFQYISNRVFGGLIGMTPEAIQPFFNAAGYVAICWLFLYFLYKKKVFLKV
jgi:predicted acyltransferase